MRMSIGGLAGWMLALLAGASALGAERVSIEDFARSPDYRMLQMSPDGSSIGFLREFQGRTHLCTKAIASPDIARFQIGQAEAFGTVVPKEVASFQWVSDRRLVVTTTVWDSLYGTAAVNRDGRDWRGLTGYEADRSGKFATPAFDLIHRFYDADHRILMLDRRDSVGAVRLFPHVLAVNTATGTSKIVVRNPGNVVSWMADHEGSVRFGMVRDEETSSVIYRQTERDEWRAYPFPTRGHEKLRPLRFAPTDGSFYVAGFNEHDRWTIFPFDLVTGTRGEPLVSDPEYDAAPSGRTPSVGGVPVAGPVFSEAKGALVGVWYAREAPKVKWFDPEFAKIQAAVDKALPDTVNVLVGNSRDDNRLLFFAFSDRHPGTYFLLDRSARSFRPIAARMEWIKPEQLSPTHAVKYTARDGLLIHGYLTVPAGHEPRNLPIVVLPHGGPWVRDIWGFDPLVQLIASRGYAVLQMNYRGSTGYGSAFAMAGTKQVGKAIQDDIEDATRWAIAAGVADPARIAIGGASYGGYSALFGIGKNPDLYRCGFSYAGVTDWIAIYMHGRTREEYRFARRKWIEEIGDPGEDEEMLRSISPVNFADAMTAPLLIIQGREDRTVPQSQARAMIDALKQAGREPESLFLSGEGHGLTSEKTRIAAYRSIVAFLEKHLGPGLPHPGP